MTYARLEFRLTDLEAARVEQAPQAVRRELLLRCWWWVLVPAGFLVAYGIVVNGSVPWVPAVGLAGGIAAFRVSLEFPRFWAPSREIVRRPTKGARLVSRGPTRIEVDDSGVANGSGRTRRSRRWAEFEGCRTHGQWIELRQGHFVALLPRRAFPSEHSFEEIRSLVETNVRVDVAMEDNLPRFLALGDSYTIGESVADRDRWPNQLAGLLRESGAADFAQPEIIAETGWTTGDLAAAIAERQPQGAYHLVSLLIGVNNQYRGRPLHEYSDQFRELLGTAIRLTGGKRERVLVLSIPDWGVTPFAEGRDRAQVGREIDAFNAVNREETACEGAFYVDVTEISRRAATEPSLIAVDGLHPSGAMYRLWAEDVLTFAAAALRG